MQNPQQSSLVVPRRSQPAPKPPLPSDLDLAQSDRQAAVCNSSDFAAPTPREFAEPCLRTIYTKMKKTAKARFNAAQRLKRHEAFLLWSTSLYSTVLGILALLPVVGLHTACSQGISVLVQVALAQLVLVFSLILYSSRFGSRSEAMQRCGLALDDLCADILPHCLSEDTDIQVYQAAVQRRANIMAVYENHVYLDFARVKLDYPEDYNITWKTKVAVRCRYCVHFAPYLILTTLFAAACAVLFVPIGLSP